MIKPKEVPPPFGIWLNLLAVVLTLNSIRFFSAVFGYRGNGAPDGYSGIDVIAQSIISPWAWVNLVLMFKRSRWFPKSMIGMFGTSAVFNVLIAASDLRTAPAADAWELKVIMVAAPTVSLLWIAYLIRSQHVRKVFVR
jgi:hypothetical protein